MTSLLKIYQTLKSISGLLNFFKKNPVLIFFFFSASTAFLQNQTAQRHFKYIFPNTMYIYIASRYAKSYSKDLRKSHTWTNLFKIWLVVQKAWIHFPYKRQNFKETRQSSPNYLITRDGQHVALLDAPDGPIPRKSLSITISRNPYSYRPMWSQEQRTCSLGTNHPRFRHVYPNSKREHQPSSCPSSRRGPVTAFSSWPPLTSSVRSSAANFAICRN